MTEEEQKLEWMYSIFNKDKIMAQKKQWTKEAEEAGMTLTEYLESINPCDIYEIKGDNTIDEKDKIFDMINQGKDIIKSGNKALIAGIFSIIIILCGIASMVMLLLGYSHWLLYLCPLVALCVYLIEFIIKFTSVIKYLILTKKAVNAVEMLKISEDKYVEE